MHFTIPAIFIVPVTRELVVGLSIMAAAPSTTIPGIKDVPKLLKKREKTPTLVFREAHDANRYVAAQIAELIRTTTGRQVVLGLATGSTPVGTLSTCS